MVGSTSTIPKKRGPAPNATSGPASGSIGHGSSSTTMNSNSTNNKKSKTSDTRSTPTTTPRKSIMDKVFTHSAPLPPADNSSTITPIEVRSTAATIMSHMESRPVDYNIPKTVVACDPKTNVKYGQPPHTSAPFSRQSPREAKSMDKTVLTMVVTDQFFPEVKFADKEFDLAWDEDMESFCQFFLLKCNVPVDVDRKDWWLKTRKTVMYIMCQTRNDRNTAVKNAFVGKYNGCASESDCVKNLTTCCWNVTSSLAQI